MHFCRGRAAFRTKHGFKKSRISVSPNSLQSTHLSSYFKINNQDYYFPCNSKVINLVAVHGLKLEIGKEKFAKSICMRYGYQAEMNGCFVGLVREPPLRN